MKAVELLKLVYAYVEARVRLNAAYEIPIPDSDQLVDGVYEAKERLVKAIKSVATPDESGSSTASSDVVDAIMRPSLEDRAVRDLLLEASKDELQEAFTDTDLADLAAQGRAAAQRALSKRPLAASHGLMNLAEGYGRACAWVDLSLGTNDWWKAMERKASLEKKLLEAIEELRDDPDQLPDAWSV